MHKNLDSVAAVKLLKALRALEVAGQLIWCCVWVVRYQFLLVFLEGGSWRSAGMRDTEHFCGRLCYATRNTCQGGNLQIGAICLQL